MARQLNSMFFIVCSVSIQIYTNEKEHGKLIVILA